MPYAAKILLDSIAPSGFRLVTMELTYPRFVHSELLTHRMFSKNSASSRAIPIEKMIQRVLDDPVLPVWWGKKQSGMQANEELSEQDKELAKFYWLDARDQMVSKVQVLNAMGLHKQISNRLLEPWMFITVILSGTNQPGVWDNFFALRCHPDAQPELQKIAYMARELYEDNKPRELKAGEWHLPLVENNDLVDLVPYGYADIGDKMSLQKIAVGRCARVSYLTHDGKRDLQADIDLHDRLLGSGHYSPFEHVAQASSTNIQSGNFMGWVQYRKTLQRRTSSS